MHGHLNTKVKDITQGDGTWDLSSLISLVNNQTLSVIMENNLPAICITNTVDFPTWVGTPNGNFSTAAAYNLIN